MLLSNRANAVQKVRSSRHYSFSVLGVCVILTVGGTLVLFATFLETILAVLFHFQRFREKESLNYAYAEWQVGSTLQLQRIAHESVGAGNWTRATKAVPVTQSDDALAVLDITDREHPRLVPSPIETREVDVIKESMGGRVSARYSKIPTMEPVEIT
jgi:hypothetical protein